MSYSCGPRGSRNKRTRWATSNLSLNLLGAITLHWWPFWGLRVSALHFAGSELTS